MKVNVVGKSTRFNLTLFNSSNCSCLLMIKTITNREIDILLPLGAYFTYI